MTNDVMITMTVGMTAEMTAGMTDGMTVTMIIGMIIGKYDLFCYSNPDFERAKVIFSIMYQVYSEKV